MEYRKKLLSGELDNPKDRTQKASATWKARQVTTSLKRTRHILMNDLQKTSLTMDTLQESSSKLKETITGKHF